MAVEGWKESTLSDVSVIKGGSTPSKAEPKYWDQEDILWATPTDVTALGESENYISSTRSKISKLALDQTALDIIQPGNVLMTSRATIGYAVINDVPITTNQGFANFIPDKDRLHPNFLLYWIRMKKKEIEKISSGSTFLEVSKKSLRNLSIDLPPIHEQKKIAEILESVDDAIAKTEAVIAQTESVKQGLLQQLLTRGIGHTKFKQSPLGEIPESWEVLSMSDFCTKVADGTHDTPQRQENGVPLLTSKNLKSYGLDFEDYYCVSIDDAREINKRSKVDQFDILYGMIGTIGNPVIVKSIERDFVIKNVALFKFGGDHLKSNWAHMFLESALMEKVISSKQAGNAQKFLSLKLLRSIEIPVPPKQEMERIITVKTNINAALEGNISKLSKLRSLKAGLMSDLLTGRVRVNVDATPTTQTEVAA